MERQETVNLLNKILDAIEHYEEIIDDCKWSNEFGEGQVNPTYEFENLDKIHTYGMCIDRCLKKQHTYVPQGICTFDRRGQ